MGGVLDVHMCGAMSCHVITSSLPACITCIDPVIIDLIMHASFLPSCLNSAGSRWPCRSFQKIHAQAAVNARLPVPAKDLAADCSDPRVTCSVGFDRQGG